MFSLLVAVIYIAFISLGLPDSLLGSAWPAMHIDVGAAVSSAGVISMIVSASTVVASLFSDRLTKKLGTGVLTAVSVFLTAASMFAFSKANSLAFLCIFAVPYGLGAGAIDAALNNYVALHLSSRHMSWLHCCWGLGATLSPYLMGLCLSGEKGWRGGYSIVAAVQLVITFIMFMSLPLWKKYSEKTSDGTETTKEKSLTTIQTLKYPGAIFSYFSFLFYCLLEILPLVWSSTYLNTVYGLSESKAASFASFFAIGMAVSRALCGFISKKTDDKHLIRYGLIIVIGAACLLAIPFSSYVTAIVAFCILGFGCGPVYPGFVHSVPTNFGTAHSGEIIGVELTFAYIGFTFSSFIFGKISDFTSIRALPFTIIFYAICCFAFSEKLNSFVKRHKIGD